MRGAGVDGGRTAKGTMFSLCLSCAAGHFCFLLVSINRRSQQPALAREWGGGSVGEEEVGGGVQDADHLQNWYELSWQKVLTVRRHKRARRLLCHSKNPSIRIESCFQKRSSLAASILNSRHGFNFLNRIWWQTLGGAQPNLFWSVEGTGSKFISQIKRQRHAGCISFVRVRAHGWQSCSESHLMNVTQASLILGERCEWKRNTNLIEMFWQRPCWDGENIYFYFTFSPFKKEMKSVFLVENLKTKERREKKHWLDNSRLRRCITLQAIKRHNAIHVMYNMQDLKKELLSCLFKKEVKTDENGNVIYLHIQLDSRWIYFYCFCRVKTEKMELVGFLIFSKACLST